MPASIRYMGSKRSLAPQIAEIISANHAGAAVVDVFAGMCAVGSALAPRHRVIANDIHAFAETVARTLLVTPGRVPSPSVAREDLKDAFESNWTQLFPSVAERLESEDRAISKVVRPGGWQIFKTFAENELSEGCPRSLPDLPAVADYQQRPSLKPYSLFSSYFASSYIGVRQAAVVDSLRFSIDQAPPERQDFYMFALLQALSYCAAAPGHFAQFLIPRDEVNTRYIARIRRRSILDRFRQVLRELRLPRCSSRSANKAFRQDATDFLNSGMLDSSKESLVIYADPPYSRAQYSRYYHVLETLVLYDYPEVTGKGRYRSGRFNTDFCRAAQVRRAMDKFIAAAASIRVPLYLSYPRNGLLFSAGGDVLDLLLGHYPAAHVLASADLAHSTLGGSPGRAAIRVTEEIYYAHWR